MSERRKGHQWKPIADVPTNMRALRFPELDALLAVFEKRRGEIEGAGALREFQTRMVRSWSIETGILEHLYTLTESATLTLLEQGFDAALLSHGDTDLPPEQLVAILRDHQDAAEGLFQFVRGGRALSTSYVKELHQVFTRHQQTCDAMDPRGNWVKVPLLRGDWKQLPNNPSDVKTGEVWHQYCPPEQVASEMDALIAMHAQHSDVHFVVEGAWLHHRFTQIHPFQDGNGRVARALASLVSIRAHGFPVVVLRKQRDSYIRALERADRGDLGALVNMFERQQQEAFTRALGLSYEAVEETQSMDAILADAKRRLESQNSVRPEELGRQLDALIEDAARTLEAAAARVSTQLAPRVSASSARSGEHDAAQYSWEIAETAKWYDYVANLSAPRGWVQLRLEYAGTSTLVVSFHHVGPAEYGVVAVSAFLTLSEGVRSAAARRTTLLEIEFVCPRPFTLTAARTAAELRESFAAWLEESLTRALDMWRRGL